MNAIVLIVDDSLTVRMDLVEAFETAGFDTLACATLAEARVALSTRGIAIAILDVNLPDGNGVDLLSEIRAGTATQALPVLMLSSEGEVRDRIRGLRMGANDYVGKPYDTGHIIERSKQLLRSDGNAAPAVTTASPVLIIDDSVTFREELRESLMRAGHRVATAATGEAGLRLAATLRPCALIVDGVMPGMDGPTVIRRLRLDAALRALPCLLLTAVEEEAAELRALDAGADAFVRKGDDMEVILARFSAMLRSARTDSEAAVSLAAPKRLLLVDASGTYVDTLAAALRDDGYDVVAAQGGAEALEILAAQKIECILLRFDGPFSESGETCRQIKAAPAVRNTPLISIGSDSDRRGMVAALDLGADDHCDQSSDIGVLRARIQAQLRRKQFEDENRRIREQFLRGELEAAEARAARELAETRAQLVEELKIKNEELEAFSYSVSHDLRAPLRAIDGFGQALTEDYADKLDEDGKRYLDYIRSSTMRMGTLIDDMLQLSRVSRGRVARKRTDMTALAETVVEGLRVQQPASLVTADIEPGLAADADPGLIRIVLENLLGNAWKFSSRTPQPRVQFYALAHGAEIAFCIRDNGAGFEMSHAAALFQPFKRLHRTSDFPGTGVGLATVRRIISKHGGRVWAEGAVNQGATFFFTLPTNASRTDDQ